MVVSVGSLTVGTYHGNIQVTAAGASNTPQNIPVTLTVSLTWTQQQELTASDGAASDFRLFSLGERGHGGDRGCWQEWLPGRRVRVCAQRRTVDQQQELTASDGAANDDFGYSVSVSGDTAVIGAAGKNGNAREPHTCLCAAAQRGASSRS